MADARIGSLLVVTEDSGADGHATVVEVLKRMLRLLVPDYQTQRVGFEPSNRDAQRAIRGPRWKSTEPRDQRDLTELFRTIATKLLRDDGFVFFHVDGDRPWAERDKSENVAKFDAVVRTRVRQVLRAQKGATAESVEQRMRRLLLLAPFYSIEAWLYQNTTAAVRLCHEHHRGRDADRFQAWAQDRTALDDVMAPKKETCLAATHNLALAGTGFPSQAVRDAARSYARCAEVLEACAELVAILDATAGRFPDA